MIKLTQKNHDRRARALARIQAEDAVEGAAPSKVMPVGGVDCDLLLSQLEPSSTNPRKYFDDEEIAELAESLKREGLLQAIVVRVQADLVTGKGGLPVYEIVCGERRYRAAKKAGWKSIRCRAVQLSDERVRLIQFAENDQRSDLRPIERARGYRQYLDDTGITQEVLAKQLGRTQGFVANCLGLLKLPEEIHDDVNSGRLPATQARLLTPYAHVPKIVRAMRQFAHEGAKQNDGQAPSVKEWQHQLSRVVARNTMPLDGYGWRITVTDANREELQLVPAPYGNGKRAANVTLVKRLASEKKRAKDKKQKGEIQESKARQSKADQRWRLDAQRGCREHLTSRLYELAIARRLRESRTEQHLIYRMFIAVCLDSESMWQVPRKLFPKLKRDVWAELEQVPTSKLTAVMQQTIDVLMSGEGGTYLKAESLQGMAGHLGIKGVAEAWALARDEAWLKKGWERECKDCGHADAGAEIPLDCPEWLLTAKKKPAKGKTKKGT